MLVLVLDDDKDILDLAAELFEMAEIETVTCSSGEEALAAVDRNKFDAIVSDIKMKGMTGIDFHRKLQETGKLVRPFVFITGYATENPEAESLVADGHADKIFLKPLQFYEIADYIKKSR